MLADLVTLAATTRLLDDSFEMPLFGNARAVNST